MTEEEYKQEWLSGKHQTEYNSCRFADDKVEFCKNWLINSIPNLSLEEPKNLRDYACKNKLKIASDNDYCILCSKWANKIAVNKELENIGFSDIIIPSVYSEYGQFSENNFNSLPDDKDLIIKCNHGSGWNLVINKQKLATSPKYIIHKVNEWLSLNYAYITGYEAQYESITPGVIIQPVMVNRPTDYGFWCVNGEIKNISLTRKYAKNLEEYIAFVDSDCIGSDVFVGLKPEQFSLTAKQKSMVYAMKPYVEKIAKLFDFVRVDMYYINGKVYFGETTFTPCSGRIEFNNEGKNEIHQ